MPYSRDDKHLFENKLVSKISMLDHLSSVLKIAVETLKAYFLDTIVELT